MTTRPSRRFHGLTLVELLTAMTVLAIVSVAATALLAGALNADRYLRAANTTESEVELACRRITYNLRTASAISVPAAVLNTPSSTLTVMTQGDPNVAGSPFTVTYSVSNGQLIETDTRYDDASGHHPNVLVNNVASFSVQYTGLNSPKLVNVTLTTAGPQAVTRSFQVACRNL